MSIGTFAPNPSPNLHPRSDDHQGDEFSDPTHAPGDTGRGDPLSSPSEHHQRPGAPRARRPVRRRRPGGARHPTDAAEILPAPLAAGEFSTLEQIDHPYDDDPSPELLDATISTGITGCVEVKPHRTQRATEQSIAVLTVRQPVIDRSDHHLATIAASLTHLRLTKRQPVTPFHSRSP